MVNLPPGHVATNGTDSKGRTIYRGPKGGLYVITARGNRGQPATAQDTTQRSTTKRSTTKRSTTKPAAEPPADRKRKAAEAFFYDTGRKVGRGDREPLSNDALGLDDAAIRRQYDLGVQQGRREVGKRTPRQSALKRSPKPTRGDERLLTRQMGRMVGLGEREPLRNAELSALDVPLRRQYEEGVKRGRAVLLTRAANTKLPPKRAQTPKAPSPKRAQTPKAPSPKRARTPKAPSPKRARTPKAPEQSSRWWWWTQKKVDASPKRDVDRKRKGGEAFFYEVGRRVGRGDREPLGNDALGMDVAAYRREYDLGVQQGRRDVGKPTPRRSAQKRSPTPAAERSETPYTTLTLEEWIRQEEQVMDILHREGVAVGRGEREPLHHDELGSTPMRREYAFAVEKGKLELVKAQRQRKMGNAIEKEKLELADAQRKPTSGKGWGRWWPSKKVDASPKRAADGQRKPTSVRAADGQRKPTSVRVVNTSDWSPTMFHEDGRMVGRGEQEPLSNAELSAADVQARRQYELGVHKGREIQRLRPAIKRGQATPGMPRANVMTMYYEMGRLVGTAEREPLHPVTLRTLDENVRRQYRLGMKSGIAAGRAPRDKLLAF